MSLPVIRSLGKAGLHVTAAEIESTPESKALGFYSRYATDKLILPEPKSYEFIETLKLVAGDTNPVILPVGIDSLLELCKEQERVSKFAQVALPPYKSIQIANDKAALMAHAQQIGIPCPTTTTLLENESVEELAKRIQYPVVIKYRAGELLRLDPQNRYTIVYDSNTFMKRFQSMHQLQSNPLVQQYIGGDGFGVSAVFDKNSNPLSVFCHHRIREYPVSGGPSCMCESTWDDTLVQHAITLLKSLDWIGVAMVEFKGEHLMEINPRFWGSLALSTASNCNIPLALYRAAIGECATGDPLPHYKLNKKMRFILQDLLSFSGYLKKTDRKLRFTAKFVGDLINPTVADGVFSFGDLRASCQYFKQALKKTDRILR